MPGQKRFRFFRAGATRFVFRVGPFVVKVPRNVIGVVSNIAEAALWKRTHSPILVPTLWSCGIINIQAFAGEHVYYDVDKELWNEAQTLGIKDLWNVNVARDWRGKQAIIDYGWTTASCYFWHETCQCT